MNYVIRNLKGSDYEMLKSWWDQAGEKAPSKSVLPEESSFILELEKQPIVSLSVCLTNTEVAYFGSFIGNPEYKNNLRKQCGQLLVTYAEEFTKKLGYKKVYCLVAKDKLIDRYKDFNFVTENSNITMMSKEI